MVITCVGRDETWTGTRPCHCGSCHETFSGLSLFDGHRSTKGGQHGSCLHPAVLRGYEFREGMWRSPEMTDEQKRDAFGDPAA